MKNKLASSEKMTDQSSNHSSLSEKINNNQQIKNNAENKLKEQKVQNNFINLRKYTMEPVLFRKEFVPVLKPIEIHLVPTKFRLNKLEYKHNRRNKKDKNILNCISCPCSENGNDIDDESDVSNSSDISDISDLSNNIKNDNNNNNNRLKDIRKKFSKLKSGTIHKVMTKKNLNNKKLSKQFDCFDNPEVDEEENESENYKGDEDSFSFDLYEENNNFANYSMKPYDNIDFELKQTKSSKIINNTLKNYEHISDQKNNEDDNDNKKDNKNNKKRNRVYSFSILETLKNKLKIDK